MAHRQIFKSIPKPIEGAHYFVFEQKPQIRSIKFTNADSDNDELCKFIKTLAFPYVQFYIGCWPRTNWKFSTYRISFSNRPVNSFKSKVYFPLLPNIYESFRVCMPPINSLVHSEMIDLFWQSSFSCGESYADSEHDSLYVGTYLLERSPLKSFDFWEQQTRSHGLDFITKVKWPCHNVSADSIDAFFYYEGLNSLSSFYDILCHDLGDSVMETLVFEKPVRW